MNKLLLALIIFSSSFSSYGVDHLESLGERGVYLYEGAEQFVDSFRKKGTSIEAMQIIYPSFEPMRILLIAQDIESESYFLITAAKNKSKPISHSVELNKSLAKNLIDVFDIVLNETKARTENRIPSTDGTVYAFYSFPYAGYRWNKGSNDKPAYLIELCEVIAKYSIAAKDLKSSVEVDKLISAIKEGNTRR